MTTDHDAAPGTPDQELRHLFDAGYHDSLSRRAAQLGDAVPLSAHPLTTLLDVAVATGRRLDLLDVTEATAALSPNDPRVLELLATLRLHIGQLEEAESAIRLSLEKRPHHRHALNLLVGILAQAGRLAEAEDVLRAQIKDTPGDSTLNTNLAVILTAQDRLDEASRYYRQAISQNPNRAQVRLNHSITLLKAGLFAQGWTEHEWRLDLPGHTSLPRQTLLPNVTPDLNLNGKQILVTQEEGLGDTLMYLRYLPLLAKRGAIVTVWGPPALARLVERIEGVARFQTGGDAPNFDYHCPFISLPRAFSASDKPFGVPVPYIQVDPAKRSLWAKRFSADLKYRVGVVWGGAPRPELTDAYMIDQRRSMPLADLAPVFTVKGATFYSLQKGPPSRQIETCDFDLQDYTEELQDMDDTAALIANLDVVISVDTSVVHLAGGMGKRVLLMDRLNPCWRWMAGRTDSPWYPHLTIIRQTRPWIWHDVAERIATIVQKEARQ